MEQDAAAQNVTVTANKTNKQSSKNLPSFMNKFDLINQKIYCMRGYMRGSLFNPTRTMLMF